MWCMGRNKKKEGASHRHLRLNWEGNPLSKIWDTRSFCRVPVSSRKLRWLTQACHPCPVLPFIPSKGFKALICVEKLHNLSKNDCGLFFISVFLKSTKWCISQYLNDWASPEWPCPGGWCSGVRGHPGRDFKGLFMSPWGSLDGGGNHGF